MEIAGIVAKSHHSRCYRLFHVQDLLVQKHQACSDDLGDQQFGKDDNLGAHEPICEHVRDHGGNNRTKVTHTALSFLVSITFVISLKS